MERQKGIALGGLGLISLAVGFWGGQAAEGSSPPPLPEGSFFNVPRLPEDEKLPPPPTPTPTPTRDNKETTPSPLSEVLYHVPTENLPAGVKPIAITIDDGGNAW